jgi:hypothetical protein
MKDVARAHRKSDTRVNDFVWRINNFMKTRTDSTGEKPIATLDSMPEAFKRFMDDSPNKYLYKDMPDGRPIPVFVVSIKYTKGQYREDKPHVVMTYAWRDRDEIKTGSVSWYASQVGRGQRTVATVLRLSGFYKETEALHAQYIDQMTRFESISGETGKQMVGTGMGIAVIRHSYWWSSKRIESLVREGQQARLVIDHMTEEVSKEDNGSYRTHKEDRIVLDWWNKDDFKKKGKAKADEDEEVEYESEDDEIEAEMTSELFVIPPLAPYLVCFDLEKHQWLRVHIDCMEPYEYSEGIEDKIILPESHKELVNILITSAGDLMEDIITGKQGGVIVMATGRPGTGKTLTAQVYSEVIQKALYVVQCSQLGVTSDSLEKSLTEVLARAQRWGAILLIDEADVYVRERGSDINQNAIVGVFLRILETYRGVLFMTSNRATIVDDAILSRCTAHIRYQMPDKASLMQIWQILGDQFGADFGKGEAKAKFYTKVVDEFPTISGRDVKSMLKLATFISKKKNKPIDLDMIRTVATFQDISEEEVK